VVVVVVLFMQTPVELPPLASATARAAQTLKSIATAVANSPQKAAIRKRLQPLRPTSIKSSARFNRQVLLRCTTSVEGGQKCESVDATSSNILDVNPPTPITVFPPLFAEEIPNASSQEAVGESPTNHSEPSPPTDRNEKLKPDEKELSVKPTPIVIDSFGDCDTSESLRVYTPLSRISSTCSVGSVQSMSVASSEYLSEEGSELEGNPVHQTPGGIETEVSTIRRALSKKCVLMNMRVASLAKQSTEMIQAKIFSPHPPNDRKRPSHITTT